MPTITVNRKVLEKVMGKKLTTDRLKDRISMLGTDLESVTDDEIVVEIFPNRPDMLSEQGFGRALSSFIGIHTGLKKYNVKRSGQKVIVSKEMEQVRPYTVAAIVKNLSLDDEKIRELIQIQEKLHITYCRRRKKAAIGIYPAEKIKFPIYFCARKPQDIVFRPLEWHKAVSADEILRQHPTGIEYRDLVKGHKKYAVFHDADNEILSFTPVINSHRTGKITDATKEAFVEVSGFDLRTAEYVLNILMAALADMGADIYSMDVVYPDKRIVTPNLEPRPMKVSLKYINKWLGLDLDERSFKNNLEKMGFGYKDKKVLVPAYRPDVIHPTDIAEDIAIAYGYENFTPQIPKKATVGQEDSLEKLRKKISQILIGLNMLEVSSYHLASAKAQFNDMNFPKREHVILANSLSEEYDIMRYWMLPNLMKILGENTHNEYPQDIFESGTVFRLGKTHTGVQEEPHLAAVLCSKDADYTKIRQVLDYLMRSLGLQYEIKEAEHPSFIDGRAGKILVGKREIGFLGELHPQVLEDFNVEMPASGFEIVLFTTYK